MKTLITILTIILLASCSSSTWYVQKRTASGTHGYSVQGWPYSNSCNGIHHKQAIKRSSVYRYSFAGRHVTQ